MKKTIFLVFFSLVYADVTYVINEITKIEKFKPIFKKINYYNIFDYEAHIKRKENITISKKGSCDLKIYAIFQNKVNINGRWFKKGDIMNGYKIFKITNNYVYLKRNDEIVKLSVTNYILKVK